MHFVQIQMSLALSTFVAVVIVLEHVKCRCESSGFFKSTTFQNGTFSLLLAVFILNDKWEISHHVSDFHNTKRTSNSLKNMLLVTKTHYDTFLSLWRCYCFA
ncbi:hypothetical protein NQD34_011105 [Periophthalmus magnuspinnatus]|nr:hypothetical protein NQD34_011105 [Periophthalmus magnuspinnatus]